MYQIAAFWKKKLSKYSVEITALLCGKKITQNLKNIWFHGSFIKNRESSKIPWWYDDNVLWKLVFFEKFREINLLTFFTKELY